MNFIPIHVLILNIHPIKFYIIKDYVNNNTLIVLVIFLTDLVQLVLHVLLILTIFFLINL